MTIITAAINQLTRNLALEWAKDKIRFLGAAGGPRIESFGCPMERAVEAEEVSHLAAFLCMPVASYITGQVLIAGSCTSRSLQSQGMQL
ncbi:hypothetical protein IEQ34_016121 [Dendrobium chrysotoxum]|uniref:Uncharacterized protein n=1 Tax=Dendrobium chrysotoxum TaxID=161865 RepID=A0AAV7GDG2_DENCH|nr:hypothetical protein IEQ34_016121 [Dendrobium chrysotoxum]